MCKFYIPYILYFYYYYCCSYYFLLFCLYLTFRYFLISFCIHVVVFLYAPFFAYYPVFVFFLIFALKEIISQRVLYNKKKRFSLSLYIYLSLFLFCSPLPFSASHFETNVWQTLHRKARPATRVRKRERSSLRPFQTFLDRCACSRQKHGEESHRWWHGGKRSRKTRAQRARREKWVFASIVGYPRELFISREDGKEERTEGRGTEMVPWWWRRTKDAKRGHKGNPVSKYGR